MASRWYFSAAGTIAGVEPAYDAGWNYTTEASRRALLAAKSASESLTIGTQIGPWTATAGQTALDRQYISEPLKAQTISGTFKGQVMTREYATTDNVDRLFVAVKVVSNDGTTVRATLFARANATTTLEFISNVTHRNKRIADGDTLSSYDCTDGDRLLIEIGYSNSTAGTTPEASARWGAPTGTNDLPENETQTTAGVGWIEFSADIGRLFTFTPSDGVALGGAASTQKINVYTASVSGGTTLAGAAEISKVHVFTASVSGGTDLAGAADTLYEPNSSNTYTYSPSGGVSLNGDAATVKVSVYTASVSGGVTLAGEAAIARTLVASASGGVTLSGSAATSEIAVYTATVSGGTAIGGAAALARTYSPAASGGTVLAGAAATSYLPAGSTEYPYTATGGVTLNGTAVTQYVEAAPQLQDSSGGGGYVVNRPRRIPTFRGVELPDPWKRYTYTGSGGPKLGGSAAVSHRKVFGWFGAGKMALGGEAKTYKPKRIRFTGSGGPRIDGKSLSFMFSPVLDEQEALELLVLD